MLNEKEVTEYQEIYKRIYGTEISKEKAFSEGISLIIFTEAVLKKNPNEQ